MTTLSTSSDTPVELAIIGGGASGLLAALQALRAGVRAEAIAIFDPQSELGRGVAYGTPFAEHVLNVPAGRMSALPDEPGHFVDFLHAADDVDAGDAGDEPWAARFASRRDYARYLQASLAAQTGADRILGMADQALDILPGPPFEILARSGIRVRARRVVLALGNRPRPFPLAVPVALPVVDAWDYPNVREIPAEARVCIVGSGLSMVDAVLSLSAGGHRGPITVLSRHGLVPLPHAAAGPHGSPSEVDDLLAPSLRQRMSALRQRVARAQAAGEPWQWTMDRIRAHGQTLWTTLTPHEQSRFLRHAVRYWDIHRHRIAPAVADTLDRLRASGQLTIQAGRLDGVRATRDGFELDWRGRGDVAAQRLPVDVVVNSTGVELDIRRMRSPLLDALQQRGLVAPGPHGLGIDCDAHGVVMSASGEAQPDFRVMGALRIGRVWESIAIPELRVQAQRIGELAGTP